MIPLRAWCGVIALVALFTAGAAPQEKKEKWVSLFNGKDLDGWTPKIRFHDLGENYANTFRVEDGLLRVRYDNYKKFDETFGHLFYKKTYSHYRLRVEYRFVDEQVPGGPGWAFRNNGIMIHGQTAKSMKKDQKFPTSIEVQLLGGKGSGDRSTANLCTPGTHVMMNGKLQKRHCISSSSKTYHGDQWVTVELEVRGGKSIKHLIDGKVVMQYTEPQLDNGKILTKGTISLQAESHPTDFRKIEILVLKE